MAEDAGTVSEYCYLFGVRVHNPIDMDEAMLRHAIETARKHIGGLKEDWQTAGDAVVAAIKEEFDATYGPSWHVIIGKHFGSKVTHDSRHFAFFYIDVRCGAARDESGPQLRADPRGRLERARKLARAPLSTVHAPAALPPAG